MQRHAGMLLAAVFGALPAVHAGLAGLHQQMVDAARHHVDLARQRRHPETVNDVRAVQPQPHRLANGQVQLIGQRDVLAAGRVAVTHFPPPHVGGDADEKRTGRWRRQPAGCSPVAVDKQAGQHGQRKNNAAADDPVRRAHQPRAGPARHRPGQQTHHTGKNQRRSGKQHPAQTGNGASGVASR